MSELPQPSAGSERLFGRVFLLLVVIIPSLVLVLPAVVGSLILFARGEHGDLGANFMALVLVGGLAALLWMLGAMGVIFVLKLALMARTRLRRPR